MTFEVMLHPQADVDALEGYHWYEARRSGLGDDFLLCVQETIDRIRRFPQAYTVVRSSSVGRDIRRAAIRRFPYNLFYGFEGEKIVIIALLHRRRSLDRLRHRLG